MKKIFIAVPILAALALPTIALANPVQGFHVRPIGGIFSFLRTQYQMASTSTTQNIAPTRYADPPTHELPVNSLFPNGMEQSDNASKVVHTVLPPTHQSMNRSLLPELDRQKTVRSSVVPARMGSVPPVHSFNSDTLLVPMVAFAEPAPGHPQVQPSRGIHNHLSGHSHGTNVGHHVVYHGRQSATLVSHRGNQQVHSGAFSHGWLHGQRSSGSTHGHSVSSGISNSHGWTHGQSVGSSYGHSIGSVASGHVSQTDTHSVGHSVGFSNAAHFWTSHLPLAKDGVDTNRIIISPNGTVTEHVAHYWSSPVVQS